MNTLLFITIVLGLEIALIAVVIYLLLRKRTQVQPEENQALLMLQNQIQEISRMVDAKLGESARMLQTQFTASANIIRDVTERLTKLDETNRQVIGFADQLNKLQDVLQNPKQRGVLGEYYLESVLKNVLPPSAYQMQYEFRDGTKVDAAIFVKDKVIPVDSKFSLENYNRLLETKPGEERNRLEKVFRQDLKNRMDETAKYVKPEEGTMEFAFMFIPSEAVFYDILVNKVGTVEAKDLIHYAWSKKVIIVSPTSFLAYLQTVLQGLRALQIEETAKEIIKRVEELGRHIANYEIYMRKLGTHLGTAVNTYNMAYKELSKVDKDVLKIAGKSAEIEPVSLLKPDTEEEIE